MGTPLTRALRCLGIVAATASASAQDLEPRRWTHLPTGLNVVGAGYAYADGDLFLDPVLQVEDAEVEAHLLALTYARSFAFAGKSARVDVLVPYQETEWSGVLEGNPASTRRDGLGDPRVRFSINLIGAPPLAGKEYLDYRGEHPGTTTVGAALAISLPLGEYKEDRLLNLGTNRFSFRPQIGVLHTRGPWSFELTGSTFLFTDNTDFFDGNELQRDPVYAIQTHVVRTLGRGWWVSAGAGYGFGGETEVNGRNNDNHIGDFLSGVSFGFPITKNQGAKLAYIRNRTQQDVGADTDSLVLAWSMRF